MYFVICELKIHASFLFAIKFKGKVTTNVIAVVETRRDGDNTLRPFEEILYLIGPYCVTKTLIKIANSKKKRLRAGGCLRCKFIQKKFPCFRFRSMLPAHVKITLISICPFKMAAVNKAIKIYQGIVGLVKLENTPSDYVCSTIHLIFKTIHQLMFHTLHIAA
jgi:hypothetical protein